MMSFADGRWSNELVTYLKGRTRELTFDWNKIAEDVRNHGKTALGFNDVSFVTPKSCREAFASDYSVDKVLQSSGFDPQTIEQPAQQSPEQPNKAKTTPTKVNVDMANMLREYENMSLDDLIEHVQKTEERMKVRREQIFGRVLSSLGGEDGLPSTDGGGFISTEFEHTRQAYNESLATREYEQLKRTAREDEARENQRLEEARNELKRRFDVGSKDREGEDPLGQAGAATLTSGAKSRYGDSGALRQGDKTDAELDFIDSLPYDPNVVKAFETYMETDEFDQMLTELEMELQAQAPAKSEDEPPSELSEILKVLETAAASSSTQADRKTAPKASGGGFSVPNPPGVAHSTPAAAVVPSVLPGTATASSESSQGRNQSPARVAAPAGEKAASTPIPSVEPSYQIRGFQSSAQRSDAPPRAAAGYGAGYGGGRGGGGRGGGRGSRGASSAFTTTAGTEHKDGYSSSDGDSAGEGDGDDGVGSSDSEDDWRAMRNRQKQSAERVQARQGGSAEAVSTAGAGGTASFWGAYGAPTTRGGAATAYQHHPTTAAAENGRHSPSAFDLAVMAERSFHSQAGDEEVSDNADSDGEGDDDEEPTPIKPLPQAVESDGEEGRIFESQSPSRDAVRAAATGAAVRSPQSATKGAGDVRFDLSEGSSSSTSTSPTPTTPTKASAQSATLPESPADVSSSPPTAVVAEQEPLATPALLSAVGPPAPLPTLSGSLASVALPPPPPMSGLLGAVGAGAAVRRPKGKVGGIMNAPRPRKGAPTLVGEEHSSVETTDSLALPETNGVAPVPATAGVEAASTSAVSEVTSPMTTAEQEPLSPATSIGAEVAPLPTHTAVERHAAALKRAIALEDLAAPVLAPLPYAYISNKSSGSMTEFPSATLPSELRGAGCSVDRIVLVDILTDLLPGKEEGGTALVALVEWLLIAVVGNYTLLAMQTHSLAGQAPVCRIVLETRSGDITASELLNVAQATALRGVFGSESATDREDSSELGDTSRTVADVLSIRDSYSAPLLADLACFASPIANELAILANSASPGDGSVANVVHAKDIAVCVVKSHVLHQQGLQQPQQRRSVLSELVGQCARQGLSLCGMRLVHLSALELFEYEGFNSVPGYTKPCVAGAESPLRYNAHILPVLCLAFHSSNALALELEEATASAASGPGAVVKAAAVSSLTNAAASILRSVLGPDDPALARKTDPASLRALYGSSKEHNLAYPVPHSVDRLLKETTFWFGGRKGKDRVDTAVRVVPPAVSLLVPAPPQYLQLRWTLSAPRSDLNAASAAQLAVVQSAVLVAVNETFGVTGLLHALITESERRSASATSEDSAVASQAFSACYLTHVGAPYVRNCTETITTRAHALRTPWSVSFTWEFTAISKLGEEPLPSGSRLLALDMQKRVSEDDCKSHEDVGLSDVVVVTVGKYPVLQPMDEFASQDVLGRRQHPSSNATAIAPILSKLLTFLPRSCDAHVVAVRTNANASGLVAAIRGYQVVENIDHAVAELQRALASSGSSTGHSAGGAGRVSASSGDKKGSSAGKLSDLEGRIAQSVRVLKARKALEVLFTEFSLSSVFIDLALRELYTYVPLPGLQRVGLDWQDQATAASEGGTGVKNTQPYATAQYLQALFPPGAFTAMGVVLVPWARDDAVMMRNLAKVFARLEKERFAIIEVKVVGGVSAALVEALYRENVVEYGAAVQAGLGARDLKAGVKAMLARVSAGSFVAVLMRRRSALLQLKSVVGPVYSAAVAEAQYPRSIACLLDPLGNIGTTGANVGKVGPGGSSAESCQVPHLLPTLSCVSVQRALQELFPHFHASHEAQQAALALNHVTQELHASAADSANIEHLTEQSENSGVVDGVQLRIPSAPRINRTAADASDAVITELQLRSAPESGPGAESSGASVLPSGLVRSVDIAGVVVTHALLQEVGIGVLFEALHREGLLLRNAYTTHLSVAAAKQLHQLAGASSLSMKPPLSLLTCAPALVLGLEGPSHSFVRFKSYPLVAKSPVLLWKLTGHTHDGAATEEGLVAAVPQGTVVGEFGVLASSSSRLAKDLYRHCFDALHGVDSAFEFKAL